MNIFIGVKPATQNGPWLTHVYKNKAYIQPLPVPDTYSDQDH